MALIVQKYGGTSVGNTDRIKNVAARVAKYHAKGDKIVVVVSAMSGVTDNLIKLAKEIMPLPNEREMDMLLATGEQTTIALTAIALHSIGIPAASMTGAQAGIVTDGVHTKAKIQNITPNAVHELLKQGNVVIVAGFQGETSQGQITTLGRGGSDLTAIALAAGQPRSRRIFARFTRMWTAFTPPTRALCRAPKSSMKSPTTKCSNSRVLAQR
jgi:aspartate kinase